MEHCNHGFIWTQDEVCIAEQCNAKKCKDVSQCSIECSSTYTYQCSAVNSLAMYVVQFSFFSVQFSFLSLWCSVIAREAASQQSADMTRFSSKQNQYLCTRSLGARWAPTSSWRPFGPLDFVLRALRALRPFDPRVGDRIGC